MAYIVVNNYDGTHWGKEFNTERGAKIALGRAHNKGKVNRHEYEIRRCDELDCKYVLRRNVMTGETFWEAEDTPNFMSPASEAYWSS